MNANQLLDAFGEIKDNYVLSAVNTRRPAAKVQRRPGRLALVAAIIAMMLLLVGCAAAVVLHLQDMKAGEEDTTRTRNDHGRKIDPTEVTVELYTPHALKDSPIQKAIMEWRDFLGQYDPEHPQVKEEDIPKKFKLSIPANYTYTYNCTTPEKAMKLEEIAAKYDLKLLDVELLAQAWQRNVMHRALGIDGVTRKDAAVKVRENTSYFYPNGNFSLELSYTLWNEDVIWTGECFATFHYAKKDTFDPTVSTTFAGQYEQWNYTAADGTPLLLVLESNGAGQVYADVGDATIFIELDPWLTDGDEKPTKEAIQQMADVFDYHVSPSPFDPALAEAWLKEADEEYQSKIGSTECASYAEFLNKKDWIERYTYALIDLNGDGVDELLLDIGVSPYGTTIYTIKDGEVKPQGGIGGPNIYYEGGVIGDVIETENLRGKYTSYSFHQYTGGERGLNYIESLSHYTDGTWIHTTDKDPYGTTVTEEEAQAILDKYIPIEVRFFPTRDFPMDTVGTTLGDVIDAEPRPSQDEMLRQYAEFAAGDSGMLHDARYYALHDVNGDGLDDLLLGATPDSFHLIMAMYRGRVTMLRYRPDYYLCQGNVVDMYYRSDNEDGNTVETHQFVKLYNGSRGKLMGSAVHNLDADIWSDIDENPMTEADAQAILEQYAHIDTGMKPISELGQ